MANEVAHLTDVLQDLADRINRGLDDAYDGLLQVCLDLAEAKAVCIQDNVTFKHYVVNNLKISYDLAKKYARVGENESPRKALADLRQGVRNRIENIRKKGVVRTTPDEMEPVDYEADPNDEPEDQEASEDWDALDRLTYIKRILSMILSIEEADWTITRELSEALAEVQSVVHRLRNKELT